MGESLKYKVSYDGKEASSSAKDIHTLIDRYDNKGKSIDWIKNEDGEILAERLRPTISTGKNKLNGDI